MSERRGVMLLLFDLPVQEREERRAYAQFRKAVLRRGYVFFQKSVYIKLLRNISSAAGERAWIGQHAPEKGSIHMMDMNLNEFRRLTAVRGDAFDISFFSDDVVFAGQPEEKEVGDDALLRMDSELSRRIAAVLGKQAEEEVPEDDAEKPDWVVTYQLPF